MKKILFLLIFVPIVYGRPPGDLRDYNYQKRSECEQACKSKNNDGSIVGYVFTEETDDDFYDCRCTFDKQEESEYILNSGKTERYRDKILSDPDYDTGDGTMSYESVNLGNEFKNNEDVDEEPKK